MIHEDERRRFMRLTVGTEATVTRIATPASARVELVDLSANGCAFHTDLALELHESVEFVLLGASARIAPLRRRGRVARVSAEQGRWLVGVEFEPE